MNEACIQLNNSRCNTKTKRIKTTTTILSSEDDDDDDTSTYVTDVVGKKHKKHSANGKKSDKVAGQRDCPACNTKNGNNQKLCKNKLNCTYAFKQPKDAAVVHQAAVLRIKKAYLEAVAPITSQSLRLAHPLPCYRDRPYAFARASTDLMHCLPEATVKAVLEHPDGLCIDFAIMKTWSRVRGIWFRSASKSQVQDGIGHCVDKHLENNPNKSVWAFIVPTTHAAHHAITPATVTGHLFYSMINVPVNELVLVRLS